VDHASPLSSHRRVSSAWAEPWGFVQCGRQMIPSVHFERTFSERPWIVFVASKVPVSTPLQPQLLADDIHQVRSRPDARMFCRLVSPPALMP
jgi:hypothetical protein